MGKRGCRLVCALLTLMMVAWIAPPAALAGGGEKGDFELGVFSGYGFPDAYKLPDGVSLDPKDEWLWGVRVGYFATPKCSLEVSYQELQTVTDATSIPNFDFDMMSVRFNGLYNFRPEKTLRPFLTLGIGLEQVETPVFVDPSGATRGGQSNDPGLNVGAGLRWFLGRNFDIRAEGRAVTVDIEDFLHTKQNNLEATLGVGIVWGGGPPPDADADGVSDKKDKCPGTPRGAMVDEKGCPKDSDGDGVYDGLDKCPDTPKGWTVDTSGCPKDSDGDGVNDALDKCPGTPAGATVDATGCPKDSDGDGVFDGIDKCAGTPKGATVDATGCPKDSDGDGVLDGLDKCPNTPRGSKVDANGCPPPEPPPPPPPPPMLPEAKKPLVLEGVTFAHDSATLTAESLVVLDKVAASMREHTDVKIQVQGHTDATGADAYNLKLSQRRAESVVKYLTDKGVAASRLSAKGLGESMPIGDNKTDAGKAKNRRVELHRVE